MTLCQSGQGAVATLPRCRDAVTTIGPYSAPIFRTMPRVPLWSAILWLGFLVLGSAFEAEEHKLLGDRGSAAAIERFKHLFCRTGPNGCLAEAYLGPLDNAEGDTVRLIGPESLRKLILRDEKSFSVEAFYHREEELNVAHPLTVWTGTADKNPSRGAFFTFGDLMAIYGDLRRSIPCDVYDPSTCSLTDDPAMFDKERRVALRDVAAGWKVASLGQFGASLGLGAISSPAVSMGKAEHGKHLVQGFNHPEDYTAEILKLAFTNHWHFSTWAFKWWLGMHKQALLLAQRAAIESVVKKNNETAERFFYAALHYEAHGLHSLSDLFATGHMIVDRFDTSESILRSWSQQDAPFPVWQRAIWAAATNNDLPNAVPRASSNELSLKNPRPKDASFTIQQTFLHMFMNKAGARVRNLKRMLKRGQVPLLASSKPAGSFRFGAFPDATFSPAENPEVAAAKAAGRPMDPFMAALLGNGDDSWVAFGDGALTFYGDKEGPFKGNKKRLNPGHVEWASAAVSDSLNSLLHAYSELLALSTEEEIKSASSRLAKSPSFYDAAANLPFSVTNFCWDTKKCFSPRTQSGYPQAGSYLPYAPLITEILGVPFDWSADEKARILPLCVGIKGASSSQTRKINSASWCAKPIDGKTFKTERALAKLRAASMGESASEQDPDQLIDNSLSHAEVDNEASPAGDSNGNGSPRFAHNTQAKANADDAATMEAFLDSFRAGKVSHQDLESAFTRTDALLAAYLSSLDQQLQAVADSSAEGGHLLRGQVRGKAA